MPAVNIIASLQSQSYVGLLLVHSSAPPVCLYALALPLPTVYGPVGHWSRIGARYS